MPWGRHFILFWNISALPRNVVTDQSCNVRKHLVEAPQFDTLRLIAFQHVRCDELLWSTVTFAFWIKPWLLWITSGSAVHAVMAAMPSFWFYLSAVSHSVFMAGLSPLSEYLRVYDIPCRYASIYMMKNIYSGVFHIFWLSFCFLARWDPKNTSTAEDHGKV